MRTRALATACGTVISLMAAMSVAQHEHPKPNQPVPERPATRDVRPSTTTQPSTTNTTLRSTASAPSVLRELEGVWRVEVQVNPEHWKMHSGAMDRTTTPSRPSDPNRVNDPNRDNIPNRVNDPTQPSTDPNRPATDPNRPANDPTRPATEPDQTTPTNPNRDSATAPPNPNNPNRIQDPFRRTNDPNNPGAGQPGQPGATIDKMVGGKSFVGYAETKLIMGDNILQQQIVVPDMLNDGLGREPGRVDGAPPTTPTTPAAGAPGNDRAINTNDAMYRGMSFLAFDQASNEYTIVFLDSRQGKIHCNTGTYDESSRRIVFHGKDDHMSKSDHGGRAMTDHGDVRVVLEVLSPTQHRVTMYASDMAGTTDRPRDADWKNPNELQNRNPAATPSATDPARRDATTPPRNTDDTNRDRTDANRNDQNRDNITDRSRALMGSGGSGTMIYQATYTKASNEDTPRFRRLLQEPGTPMIDRDGLRPNDRDRTTPGTTPATRPGERDD